MPAAKFTAPSPKAVVGKVVLGYCQKSLKEYSNFLNISIGSCGEFHSCYDSCYQPGQIGKEDYEEIEQLHYRVENELLRLIASLKRKARKGERAEDLLMEKWDRGLQNLEYS